MEPLIASEQARRGVWGVILIAVGSVLLLDRLHLIQLHLSGDWWPAILIAFGMAQAVTAPSLRKMLDGASFAMLGVWFFACIRNPHAV